MEDALLQYGLGGIGLFAMGWFILYLMKDHKKERKEWLDTMEKLFNKSDERDKNTNDIIKENTGILSGLKTLFEISLKKDK